MEVCMQACGLSVRSGSQTILKNLDFTIYKHKITAIIGMSGCGKTTLLKTLHRSADFQDATVTGEIRLEGENIQAWPATLVRQKIGLVSQKPTPFPFSIWKNMTYALHYYGIRKRQDQEPIIRECLEKAGLWDEVGQHLEWDARDLSGGQQQRLCIARSLTVRPQILLLDEPCSSLDIRNTLKIEETLKKLRQSCSIVMVTHNLTQARRLADYTCFMEDGRAVEFAPTIELFEAPQKKETRDYLAFM